MSTITINWLNKCRCGNKSHTVKTVRGNETGLWDDDAVKCNSCGRGGVIQVCEGQARVLWETDEEMAEGKSMSTITKELAKLFRKITNSEIDSEGNAHAVLSPADSALLIRARIALASLEAEPAYFINRVKHSDAYGDDVELRTYCYELDALKSKEDFGGEIVPVYTAPPATVVPDERYQHLSEIYHAQEKRLFKLAQSIKGPSFDKYAHSPSQAIDVLESAIFGECEDEDCRAAMLQGAEHLTEAYKLPGDFESFISWLTGGNGIPDWLINGDKIDDEKVSFLLKVYRAGAHGAVGNSPVIPDGWVILPAEPTQAMMNAWLSEVANWRGHAAGYRAMIAAAPQQE